MTLLHETGSHIRWKEVRELVVGEGGRWGLPGGLGWGGGTTMDPPALPGQMPGI